MTPTTNFSVVVTNYNYRQYVLEAVASALDQDRAPRQVIVVDDGSRDGSADLLRSHFGDDPRVTLMLGENGGQLSAFRRGLTAADGDVVCFLDADDRWRPDYLARIGALYDRRGDVDFVFTDLRLFDREHGRVAFAERAIDLGFTSVVTYLSAHWYGAPTSALSLRRPWAQRALDLPPEFDRDWRISADNCLVFGASVLGARKYFLPTEGSVEYRIHGNNGWWSRQSAESEYRNSWRSRCLIEYYARRIHLAPPCLKLARKEFLAKPGPDWDEAKRYAGAGRHQHGLGRLWRAWRLYRRRSLA